MSNNSITLAMTGASGVIYGLRLLECLLEADEQVNLLVSAPAQVVLAMESELNVPSQAKEMEQFFCDYFNAQYGQLQVYAKEQWTSPVASGSSVSRAMVVCPCTSATLSAIANGTSSNLLERAADVVLKEQQKLILVNREMPLSAIHLEHMLKLARLGVVIMPANPGFYHQPQSVNDLVDFVVARVLDHLDIEHSLVPRWGE
ncbi:MAG: flavin prenyltransferase UbiX [Gammaproteobacteria bacterium]